MIDQKVFFITGAGSGIGKATTLSLLAAGAKVFGIGRDPSKLEALKRERPTPNLATRVCDVSDEASVAEAFADCAARFGRLDGLLNNAGLGIPTPDLSEAKLADFEAMFNTNVRGTFLCTREALRLMKPAKAGHIVNIVSVAGQKTNPTAPLYCASKFGQRGVGLGLADQALKLGIRVSEVNPSATDSAYWGDRKVAREKMLKVEDVASVILWVFSAPEHMLIRQVDVDSMAWLTQ
ncbi:MAG: SDR family oxidoreductase [Spirochaetes bacterium]|nr:SDR family oxidoreductase [Spirochaetota bacterium]